MHAKRHIRCVIDPADTVEHDQFVRDLHEQEGVVVAEITSTSGGRLALALAVLRGLGKQAQLSGTGRDVNDLWDAITCWLVARPIAHLIIARAQLLDRHLWEEAAGWAAQAHAQLWLLVAGPKLSRGQREMLSQWPSQLLDPESFSGAWRRLRPVTRPVLRTAEPPFPAVPADNFLGFRSACRDLLNAPEHAVVDQLWRRTYAAVRDACANTRAMGPAQAAALLRRLIEAEDGIDRRITVARAAQSAFFVSGKLLKLNTHRLALSAGGTQLDEASIRLLSAYPNPRQAALGCLAALTGAPPRELGELNLNDLTIDGRRVTFRGRTFQVPDGVDWVLAAARLWRIREGAEEGEPLFIYRPGGGGRYNSATPTRATSHALQMPLRRISRETGLVFSGLTVSRATDRSPSAWLGQRGFSLQDLS